MSEIRQTPMITAPKKIQGRRKPWTQRHQQKRTADLITREPQGAAELESVAGSEAQITFNMPPQALEITQRRAITAEDRVSVSPYIVCDDKLFDC